MHWAADGGHAEVISLLIDAGAQLEAQNRDNVSASMGSVGCPIICIICSSHWEC